MANSFPRILTLLRKERGLSQKEAAAGLGVSQALLSHYENGIRECGLDFLCRAADFYRVSCDYLLGRTPDRTGALLTTESLPDASAEDVADGLPLLSKKLTMNSLNILFDLLLQSGNAQLTQQSSLFLMTAVYRVLRILHLANAKNPKDMFAVSARMYHAEAVSLMQLSEARALRAFSGRGAAGADGTPVLAISPERLTQGYPLYAASLLNLVDMVEQGMQALESANGTAKEPNA